MQIAIEVSRASRRGSAAFGQQSQGTEQVEGDVDLGVVWMVTLQYDNCKKCVAS